MGQRGATRTECSLGCLHDCGFRGSGKASSVTRPGFVKLKRLKVSSSADIAAARLLAMAPFAIELVRDRAPELIAAPASLSSVSALHSGRRCCC